MTHYQIVKEAATGRVRLQGPDGTKSDTYESVDQLLTAYKIPQVRLSHSSNARHCGQIGHSIDVTLCACPHPQIRQLTNTSTSPCLLTAIVFALHLLPTHRVHLPTRRGCRAQLLLGSLSRAMRSRYGLAMVRLRTSRLKVQRLRRPASRTGAQDAPSVACGPRVQTPDSHTSAPWHSGSTILLDI